MTLLSITAALLILAGSANAAECVGDGSCDELACASPFNDALSVAGFAYQGDYNYCTGSDTELNAYQVGNNSELCETMWGMPTSLCIHVYAEQNLFCPYGPELGADVTFADCVCEAAPCEGTEPVLARIDFTDSFFLSGIPPTTTTVAPAITGYAVAAESISAVGAIIFAVAALAGAIVSIVAAFAVLTLVTHAVKALSGPLTKGLR